MVMFNRVSLRLVLDSAAAILILCLPVTAKAADSKSSSPATIKVVDLNRVLVVQYNGKNLTCYKKNAKTVYLGKLSKNRKTFISEHLKFKKKIADLKEKAADAETKKKADALNAQIKALKADDAAKKSACLSTGTTPPPTGPIFPTPQPSNPAESLAPLSRALTAADIAYLGEKAGFGMGTAEHYLYQIGTDQGVDALVGEFMRDKGEDLNLEYRLQDRLDNVLANTTPAAQSIDGARKALLDWTIFSRNPYRMRMVYFLMSLFPTHSNYLAQANGQTPTQIHLWWEYVQFVRQYASYPDIPRFALNVQQQVNVVFSSLNNSNNESIPNEALARMLLDRVGTGGYCFDASGNKIRAYLDERGGSAADSDVARIARRLTGWLVGLENTGLNTPEFWAAKFSTDDHALGPEVIFEGTTGEASTEDDRDTIPAIFNSPCAAWNMSRLLLQEFVTPNPPPGLIKNFAELIKASSFNIEYPMTVLLKSEAFYHSAYRNTITKNPLELMVEFIKVMHLEDAAYVYYAANTGALLSDRLPVVDGYLLAMDWDPSRPRFWNLFNRQSWEGSTAMSRNLEQLAILMRDGLTITRPGTNPPLPFLPLDVAIPKGGLTHDQLFTYVTEKFGVTFNQAQIDELNIFLTFQFGTDGTYTRVPAYDNTIDAQRRTKGLGMLLIAMTQPGFLLK